MLRKFLFLAAVLGAAFAANAATTDQATTQAAPTEQTAVATTDQAPMVATKAVKKSTKIVKKTAITEKVNINTADEQVLSKVKGICAKKAKAIVDYRTTNGEFKSVDDLLNVKAKGISKKWLEKVSKHLTV
jgi:competence protein ComEA